MIQVADNFNYRGKKPNFDRDSFDTLQDMKNYSENSLDDGHISYCKETDKHYKFNSNNQSDPTTGKWVEQHEAVPADEEDITEQNGTLQLANKTYDKQSFSGLGRVYLRKNIVGDKNVLTQAMINKANTIYVIQYDYDLNNESIYIPEGCILDFEGGSLNGGVIYSTKTDYSNYPDGVIAPHKQTLFLCYYDEQTGTIRRYDGNRWDTKLAGTSDKRPTENLIVGTCYFDITLNKPIYYNGSKWVDATGATV